MALQPLLANGVKAIVFDIDGTLYQQAPLRREMVRRLVAAHATRPFEAFRTFCVLRAYRRAQERLRGDESGDVANAQLGMACESTGFDTTFVAGCVRRWMEQEPLAILRKHVQPGLLQLLDRCRARDVRLATLSDYPGDDKLEALGVAHYFDMSLCAQAAEIGVFKPNPKGLRVALDRLGVAPSEALYVGDRVDVDAAAAEAAGMPYAIVSRSHRRAGGPGCVPARNYAELQELLFGSGATRLVA